MVTPVAISSLKWPKNLRTFLSSWQNLGTKGGGGAHRVNPLISSGSGYLDRGYQEHLMPAEDRASLEHVHELTPDMMWELLGERGLAPDTPRLPALHPGKQGLLPLVHLHL